MSSAELTRPIPSQPWTRQGVKRTNGRSASDQEIRSLTLRIGEQKPIATIRASNASASSAETMRSAQNARRMPMVPVTGIPRPAQHLPGRTDTPS